MHDFLFVEERVCFSSLLVALSFLSLFLFISYETLIPFLQNSPFLSKQFILKCFNNYFPKKGEILLHKIFKL
jgi:hypothetical protein